MVRSSKGFRVGTRNLLKKSFRSKFKPETYLRSFNVGDRVVIKINPSSQKGMPHSRMQGNIGEIVKKVGNAYMVKITNKNKSVITRPEHLKLVK
ncbi:MAG: 50S ribosomal protein L21e [Nanoarchaeota archaeon]|nr:50S ribosomal protein L21e [Nanoarchaeota archaeon]